MILAWKLAPALATGNTVVIKPSEVTPLTSLRLVELCAEAGFPPGVVNIVTGDGSVGDLLARHPDVDHLSYTGSTAVGRLITKASAESNLKRLTLELGGKAPSIIARDADIDAAVAGNVMGATLNSGQVCAAYTRFYVDRAREQEFVDKVGQALAQVPIGPGADESTVLGPLVSAKHLAHVERAGRHRRRTTVPSWSPADAGSTVTATSSSPPSSGASPTTRRSCGRRSSGRCSR